MGMADGMVDLSLRLGEALGRVTRPIMVNDVTARHDGPYQRANSTRRRLKTIYLMRSTSNMATAHASRTDSRRSRARIVGGASYAATWRSGSKDGQSAWRDPGPLRALCNQRWARGLLFNADP